MEVGIDIVDVKRFKRVLFKGGEIFLRKIYTETELSNYPGEKPVLNVEHLAGIFSIKECAIKTDIIKPGEWLSIEVITESTGKPKLRWLNGSFIENVSISISHTKDTCVTVLIRS